MTREEMVACEDCDYWERCGGTGKPRAGVCPRVKRLHARPRPRLGARDP